MKMREYGAPLPPRLRRRQHARRHATVTPPSSTSHHILAAHDAKRGGARERAPRYGAAMHR